MRVLDNLTTGKRENLAEVAGDVDLHVGDIRDEGAAGLIATHNHDLARRAELGSLGLQLLDLGRQRSHLLAQLLSLPAVVGFGPLPPDFVQLVL